MSRIYTDGSCRMGVGGWAWWNEDTNEVKSGFAHNTTNQRMEIYAAYEALHDHMDDEEITIVSDSAYLVNCFGQDWWIRWQRNKWLKSDGITVANRDIWEPLIDLVQEHGHVRFEWVRGHSGVHGNEKVDAIAQKEMQQATIAAEASAEKTKAALERNKVELSNEEDLSYGKELLAVLQKEMQSGTTG